MPKSSRIKKTPYRSDVIHNALFLQKNGIGSGKICKILGVRSRQTISNWSKLDMSEIGIAKRKQNKGFANRLLTPNQEKIISGWLIIKSILKESVTTLNLRSFVLKEFGQRISSSWITRYMKRNHFSLKESSIAKGGECIEVKVQEGIDFLKKLRSLGKQPHQIAVMDKTKFYYESRKVKNISMKGAGRPRVRKQNRGTPDCMYSLLVANGTLGPIYIESTVKKHVLGYKMKKEVGNVVHLAKNTTRRGETGCLKFIKTCIKNETLIPGDLLLTDNEASFKTEAVKKLLKENEILVMYFPSYLNHLMSPCDNYFHSSMKRRYWWTINNKVNITYNEKIEAITKAYFAETEDSIINYFKNCGIIGTKKPKEVMKKLLKEGLFPKKRFHELHNEQILSYIKYKSEGTCQNLEDFLLYFHPNEYTPLFI
jgi:transposase